MKFELQVNDDFYKQDPDAVRFLKALQEMVNRMGVSHFKYGLMGAKCPHESHAIDGGRQRAWMYDGVGEPVTGKKGNTGNTENLLDAANFFVIESLFPSHPKAFFKSQTSAQSPGLVFREGEEKFNYTPQEGAYSQR